MKVLVTGADGFVGSHLCESFLKENHEIVALSRNFTKLSNMKNDFKKLVYYIVNHF